MGGGFLTNIPRRDMTDAEVGELSPELRWIVGRSPFYAAIPDNAVQPERTDYTNPALPWPRVLMFTPTLRFEARTAAAARAIIAEYPGVIDWFVTKDNPHPADDRRGYPNILRNLTRARAMVLDGGYDALFVLESDIVPPPDVLARLAKIDADVAGGMYGLRGDSWTTNVFPYVPRQIACGACIEPVEIVRLWGKHTRANGVCLGCALIRRNVLERVKFRLVDGESPAPDWWFMEDCNALGLTVVADLGVRCEHIGEHGEVYRVHPDGYSRKEHSWHT